MNSTLKKRLSVTALALSGAGLIAISGFEGFSEKAYVPVPGDRITIGYGHTGQVQLGDTITKDEALQLLRKDVEVAEKAVRRCVKVPLSQNEFDAYVSFTFNVGEGNFCSSTLVKKLNTKDYLGACRELKRWVYSSGVKYKGLENRRSVETLICTNGDYPKDARTEHPLN